jgi:hypothetical protein
MKKIIATTLIFLIWILLTSCGMSSSQTAEYITYEKDTQSSYDTTIIYLNEKNLQPIDSLISYSSVFDSRKDTIVKRTVFHREIKPMEIDSIYVIKRDSSYQKLEKTEMELKEQHRQLDSLLLIKKR